ncbi:uncharacterized protein B0T15DRAFT_515355 [Chaetomium strumarium]|uniref:Uncharacterized protein n=1 Tax=Chaetomium strumarium TaxID=1170767 RepID=A0AAJ0H050_9PEZI|nr:hypothetical protein B0T15DRAFT_515355 [Chaetomium strumarium]
MEINNQRFRGSRRSPHRKHQRLPSLIPKPSRLLSNVLGFLFQPSQPGPETPDSGPRNASRPLKGGVMISFRRGHHHGALRARRRSYKIKGSFIDDPKADEEAVEKIKEFLAEKDGKAKEGSRSSKSAMAQGLPVAADGETVDEGKTAQKPQRQSQNRHRLQLQRPPRHQRQREREACRHRGRGDRIEVGEVKCVGIRR